MNLACCAALPWATLPAGCGSGGQSPQPRAAPAAGVQPWGSQLQPCHPQVCPDPASQGSAELCCHRELHPKMWRKPRISCLPALLRR